MSEEIDWAAIDEAVSALQDAHSRQFAAELRTRLALGGKHPVRVSGRSRENGNYAYGIEEWVPSLGRYAPSGRIIEPLWAGEETRYESLSGRRVPWREDWHAAWKDFKVNLISDLYWTDAEALTLHHARFH